MAPLLLVAVVIAACAGSSQTPAAGDEHADGRLLFMSRCSACHILPKPTLKTDEEWPALVARYGERAKLDSEQIGKITRYLMAAN